MTDLRVAERVRARLAPAPDRVVIINDASTARGGATGLALALAGWLRARDVRVTFVTGDDGHNPALAAADIEVVALSQAALVDARRGTALVRGLYNRQSRELLEGWIERHDAPGTVYHVHGWSKILSPSIFAALHRVADRLVISAHDFFLVCPNGGYANFRTHEVCALRPLSGACLITNCDRRNYRHKLWRAARQVVLNRIVADLPQGTPIVAIHPGMRPFLERGGIPAADIKVLRNPVMPYSTSRIPAERNEEILFIGRLHAEKGPDLLARAARACGARLRIVGDGPMRDALAREFPEVILEGWRSRAELMALAKKARLLVMPSRYPEPFGLVAVEALASGLPVVTASGAFLAPEIETLGAGLSCDPTDTATLSGILRELMRDDRAVAAMSSRAFHSGRTLASGPQQWTDGLIELYNQAIESR